jgi:flagellar biosynthesis/type III secretory pathway protein FliH
MEKKQTVVFELLSAIPTGAEIKQFIFENDADEKMLDEWLWAKVYKAKDWKQMEREQIEEAYNEGADNEYLNRRGDKYYTQTFKP